MTGVRTEIAPPDRDDGAQSETADNAKAETAVRTESFPPDAGVSLPVDPGEVLGDRYRVLDVIGRGGMGVVYVAEHITIGKPVAIKVLGEEFSHRTALVERFLQEARAVSKIRHENIVDITDFGFVRDGVPYFVMEYLEGQTLAERIATRGPLPWKVAREIMLQICSALEAAHGKGVIHRDMKPDNVFLIDRGLASPTVKVLDFGIAKVLEDGDKNLTRTGTVMGTAAYMSPEQAQSLPLDARTDIYAAGITLYEMLTGRVPFDAGGFVGVLTKHITERVPSMRKIAPSAGIPAALDRLVLRTLRKDRRERHGSAAELGDALRDLGQHGGDGSTRWLAVAAIVGIAGGVGAWAATKDTTGDRIDAPPAALPAATMNPPRPATPAPRTRPDPTKSEVPPAELPEVLPPPPLRADAGELPDVNAIDETGPTSDGDTEGDAEATPASAQPDLPTVEARDDEASSDSESSGA